MPIDTVLFDHDDTLVATFPLRAKAWAIAAQRALGVEIDGVAHLHTGLGEPIERTALRLTGGDEALAARLVQTYRDIYYPLSDAEIVPFPGVVDTLVRLQERAVRLAV